LICLIFCLSTVGSGYAEEAKALNLPHHLSTKVDEQKDDEFNHHEPQQALEPYDVNDGYMNDDTELVDDGETDESDENVSNDKRARFAFAKRARFAFAKRAKFAFAKRARFAFAKRPSFAKRPNFAFAKRPSFAFAKRAGPSRFAFAKKSAEE